MAASPSQVRLEDREPVIVLLLGGVRLAEPALEEPEVVVGAQQVVTVDNLLDHEVLAISRVAATAAIVVTTRREKTMRREKRRSIFCV